MFLLSIVTPEKVFFEQEVVSLIAPGSEGYLGVLTDHAPLITGLVPGKLSVKDQKRKELVFAIGGCFMEVFANHVTILAHSVESVDDIHYERAKKALERADRRLRSKDEGIDVARALAARRRAENRCHLCELIRKGYHK
jgi:F-type H+-transporting ATPase subunit epsilon